jgi:hypothetical protein
MLIAAPLFGPELIIFKLIGCYRVFRVYQDPFMTALEFVLQLNPSNSIVAASAFLEFSRRESILGSIVNNLFLQKHFLLEVAMRIALQKVDGLTSFAASLLSIEQSKLVKELSLSAVRDLVQMLLKVSYKSDYIWRRISVLKSIAIICGIWKITLSHDDFNVLFNPQSFTKEYPGFIRILALETLILLLSCSLSQNDTEKLSSKIAFEHLCRNQHCNLALVLAVHFFTNNIGSIHSCLQEYLNVPITFSCCLLM